VTRVQVERRSFVDVCGSIAPPAAALRGGDDLREPPGSRPPLPLDRARRLRDGARFAAAAGAVCDGPPVRIYTAIGVLIGSTRFGVSPGCSGAGLDRCADLQRKAAQSHQETGGSNHAEV
jgi:hypothetical protein